MLQCHTHSQGPASCGWTDDTLAHNPSSNLSFLSLFQKFIPCWHLQDVSPNFSWVQASPKFTAWLGLFLLMPWWWSPWTILGSFYVQALWLWSVHSSATKIQSSNGNPFGFSPQCMSLQPWHNVLERSIGAHWNQNPGWQFHSKLSLRLPKASGMVTEVK
jgi:hypothetical protein